MGSKTSGVDFALIGHLESWQKIENVVHALRGTDQKPLSMDDIREIVPWIPPRTVVRVKTRSIIDGREVTGVYIDTFITPDNLQIESFKKNIGKVQNAALYAHREGASIAALGGFTSIVLEGNSSLLPPGKTVFTTGNTLTVAYIVKGIEKIATLMGVSLKQSRVLIVGATGDIGSGCANYLASHVEELCLCALNVNRLTDQFNKFKSQGFRTIVIADAKEYLPKADFVIMAASLARPEYTLGLCKKGAIVCDAGYPKNVVEQGLSSDAVTLYYGGMGQVLGGFFFEPDLTKAFYEYPLPFIGHGCMLEGMLLALEQRYEAYSQGRGNIVVGRIEEMWGLAQKHGFAIAPYFNNEGVLNISKPITERKPHGRTSSII